MYELNLPRNYLPKREIQIVRVWVDGQYVFLHACQVLTQGGAMDQLFYP